MIKTALTSLLSLSLLSFASSTLRAQDFGHAPATYKAPPSVLRAGSAIDPELARSWMTNYESANPGRVRGQLFGRQIVLKLLAQEGCEGLRMYHALEPSALGDKAPGNPHIILVCVDRNDKDLWPAAENGFRFLVAQRSAPCGKHCGQYRTVAPGGGAAPALEKQPLEVATVGGEFDPGVARQWMGNYKKQNPGKVRGQLFGKEIVLRILAQEGVDGLRLYHAIEPASVAGKTSGNAHIILVGVDRANDDLWPSAENGFRHLIAERSVPCGTCGDDK